jgi:protein required for attachment to host cells
MARVWVVVANSSKARLFADAPARQLRLFKEFKHNRSRLPAAALVTDRPGHYQAPSNERGAYAETDPHKAEMERFAQELAELLARGRVSHLYQNLILVASPAFLGTLNRALDARVRALVSETIAKDYTTFNMRELAAQLREFIPKPQPRNL